MGDGDTEQPQDPMFHAEHPWMHLDLPSRNQTLAAGSSSQSLNPYMSFAHYPSTDGSDPISRQSIPDERWTSASHHTNLMSSWQHSGASWLQLDEGLSLPAYSDPFVSNRTYSGMSMDWGAAAFQYASSVVPTHDGELPGIVALAAHLAHAQMLRGQSTITPPFASEPQSQFTVAICPLRGGETRSVDGIRSNEIQVRTQVAGSMIAIDDKFVGC